MMMNMTVKPVKVTEMTKEETRNTLIFPFQNSILLNIFCIMQEFEVKRISVFEEKK